MSVACLYYLQISDYEIVLTKLTWKLIDSLGVLQEDSEKLRKELHNGKFEDNNMFKCQLSSATH